MSMRITDSMQSKVAHSQVSNLFTRKNIMTAITPSPAYDVQLSYESKSKFHDEVSKSQVAFQAQISTNSLLKKGTVYAGFIDGDEGLAMMIEFERWENAHPEIANPMHADAKEHFEKYEDAWNIIQKGGAKVFSEYNIDLAAISAKEIEKDMDWRDEKQIDMGRYTAADYTKAKNYAKKLEEQANVFVCANFETDITDGKDYDAYNKDYAGTLRFAYNGALVNIGVRELDFMADHDEGNAVWVKAVQGTYKNHAEIEEALKSAGLTDTAKAYDDNLKISYLDADKARNLEFTQEHGNLWDAILDPVNITSDAKGKKYAALQKEMLGDKTSERLSYTKEDLIKALEGADKEEKFFDAIGKSRDPKLLFADDSQAKKKATPQQDLLQEMLQTLQQQLTNVKSSRMSTRQKEAMMENIQEKITTVKERILKRKAEEAEEKAGK